MGYSGEGVISYVGEIPNNACQSLVALTALARGRDKEAMGMFALGVR